MVTGEDSVGLTSQAPQDGAGRETSGDCLILGLLIETG